MHQIGTSFLFFLNGAGRKICKRDTMTFSKSTLMQCNHEGLCIHTLFYGRCLSGDEAVCPIGGKCMRLKGQPWQNDLD